MDNQMLYQMFVNMLAKMNDAEIDVALEKAKGMMSENDYEKVKKLAEEYKKNR